MIIDLLNSPQNDAVAEHLALRLMEFNQQFRGYDFLPLRLGYFSSSKQLIGGLLGNTGWDWLNIDVLFVEEAMRNQNIATQLLTEALSIAKQRGCVGAYVDTFEFQARDFYLKQGFDEFGRLESFPIGSTRYWMRKRLL